MGGHGARPPDFAILLARNLAMIIIVSIGFQVPDDLDGFAGWVAQRHEVNRRDAQDVPARDVPRV